MSSKWKFPGSQSYTWWYALTTIVWRLQDLRTWFENIRFLILKGHTLKSIFLYQQLLFPKERTDTVKILTITIATIGGEILAPGRVWVMGAIFSTNSCKVRYWTLKPIHWRKSNAITEDGGDSKPKINFHANSSLDQKGRVGVARNPIISLETIEEKFHHEGKFGLFINNESNRFSQLLQYPKLKLRNFCSHALLSQIRRILEITYTTYFFRFFPVIWLH